MVKIKVNLANSNNYGGERDLRNIKYIVVHYTGNDGDSDESNANYFKTHVVQASAHYFVDGNSITQSVLDDRVAYSVGGKKWTDCAKTGGGKLYGVVTNANSISVELCDEVKNGKADFTEATIRNAIDLIRLLMKKYNIDLNHVVRHFDVNGKHCPVPFMNAAAWGNFKTRLGGGEVVEKKTFFIDNTPVAMDSILSEGVNFVKLRDILNALGYTVKVTGKRIDILKK